MGRALLNSDVAYEKLRREQDTGDGRYVDMRIDVELDGEILYSAGGRWDRRARAFDGDAETGVVAAAHPGQRSAVEWFADWMAAHVERRETPPVYTIDDLDSYELDTDPAHVYSALFAGGRRGGKTWIAVALAVAYAVQHPGAIVWLVAPNAEKWDELRAYVQLFVAPEWVDHENAGGWDLCNGSSLTLKSAYNPDLLKEGKANFVLLNEGQMMKPRTYTVARGAIVDASGLVMVCANPPLEPKDDSWVDDFAQDAQIGKRAAVYYHFNPLLNPHIDRGALLSFRHEVDKRSFEIEVLGKFLQPKNRVAYNWLRAENERPVADPKLAAALGTPELVDVTAPFLASIGEGPGIEQVAGLDVQRYPHIGGPVYRFFAPFGVTPTIENVLVWGVGEVVLEGGDEEDYCEGLRELGYLPATTLVVCDATGEYQHSRRGPNQMEPPEWNGRGSFSVIMGAGYRRIVPPDRRMRRKNPAIQDRMRAFTSLIETESGRRRLYLDPDKCPKTAKAIREWKVVNGMPSRTHEPAHLGDGASYPICRFFPRRLRPNLGKGAKGANRQGVNDDLAARVDRAPAIPATPLDLRVLPPRHPRTGTRGSRTRGM
jgi:hypothetical protein